MSFHPSIGCTCASAADTTHTIDVPGARATLVKRRASEAHCSLKTMMRCLLSCCCSCGMRATSPSDGGEADNDRQARSIEPLL